MKKFSTVSFEKAFTNQDYMFLCFSFFFVGLTNIFS